MKLMIIGHGRHGKDTACEILRDDWGLTFESSSRFCSKRFIFDELKDKYGYETEEECYADRHNHRAEWFDMICGFNDPDLAALGKEIYKVHDIYCGIRNKREFHSLRNCGAFNYAVWIDRSDHVPLEDTDSMNLEPWMADFIVDNNGTLDQLKFNISQLMTHLRMEEQKFENLEIFVRTLQNDVQELQRGPVFV